MADLNEKDFSIPGEGKVRKCPECGEEVNARFKFCPACGYLLPEAPPPATPRPRRVVVPPDETPWDRIYPKEGAGLADQTGGAYQGRRSRANADGAERSFREFNTIARSRRRKDDKKSALSIIFGVMIFLLSLGGGAFWFLRQSAEMPWDSAVVERPHKGKDSTEISDGGASPLTQPSADGEGAADEAPEVELPALPAAPDPVLALPGPPVAQELIWPTKGIVIGSSVNLRGSHGIDSPIVGKATAGNRMDVFEAWTPDDSNEAVTLTDLELTSAEGKKLKVARGRGVVIAGEPDDSGMRPVTLPEDKSKAIYKVAAHSLSDPLAWPWFRIQPQGGGKEAWIFGQFLTVFDSRGETLSVLFLDKALATFGATAEHVQEALGKAKKSTTKKIPTPQGEGGETTLVMDGATAVLYDGPGGPEVRRMVLTSSKHLLDGGLSVGMERRQVLSLLGYPSDMDRGEEIYRAGKTTGIRIKYENYRIKTLTVGSLH